MADPSDVRFGRIALASGFLNMQQIDEGMGLVAAAPGRRLPDVLVERGYLTAEQCAAIRQIQQLTASGDTALLRKVAEPRSPAPAEPSPPPPPPAPAPAPAPPTPAPPLWATPAALPAPPAPPLDDFVLIEEIPGAPAPHAAAPAAAAVPVSAPPRPAPAPAPAPAAARAPAPAPMPTPAPAPPAEPRPVPLRTPGIAPAPGVSAEPSRRMSLFGKLILQRGWATEAQVCEGLRLQQESELAGRARQLGEILVDQGLLTVGQVKELLAEQNKAILKCEGCGTKYNVTGLEPGKNIKCMKCGANLVVPKRLGSPGVEGTVHIHPTGDPLLGKVLGGCKILQKLGKGGMAAVYKAKHLGLDKNFAVKILPPASAINNELISRFISEARTMARINHPNIVQVHNVGREQGYNFIVMDLVGGRTLTEVLAENGRIMVHEASRIIAEVARGLGVAHKHGVIHRDVKPDNIMIGENGEVRIMDFGLASDVQTSGKKTGPGTPVIAGTPYYMSPEHWAGKAVDARSDLYSLGVTLFFILTGHKPFKADDTLTLMRMHAKDEPPSPKKYFDNIPDGLCAVVAKMLSKKPSNRYQNAEELLKDFDRIKSGLDPLAMKVVGEKSLECPFCSQLNPVTARKCSVCGEYLQKSEQKLDMVLDEDEFYCPKCKFLGRRGSPQCPQCGSIFCHNCQVALAKIEGYCARCHAELPPPPPEGKVRRRK